MSVDQMRPNASREHRFPPMFVLTADPEAASDGVHVRPEGRAGGERELAA